MEDEELTVDDIKALLLAEIRYNIHQAFKAKKFHEVQGLMLDMERSLNNKIDAIIELVNEGDRSKKQGYQILDIPEYVLKGC